MEDLGGRVALVTGAGQGIGEAISVELAKCGASVAVVDTNIAAVERVSSEIQSMGSQAFAIRADVTVSEDVESAVSQIMRRWGRIDILVNNVGISPKKKGEKVPTCEITDSEWDLVLNVNLKSVFICTKIVSKIMMKQNKGSILNISSISAKTADSGPPGAHYCSSKAGVMNFTKFSARELVSYGIRVNSIAPGTIQTAHRKATSEKFNEIMLSQIPMGRFGLPQEIAKAAVFLVSESASYITGEILDVNGGALMD